jgi:hypothetical protein
LWRWLKCPLFSSSGRARRASSSLLPLLHSIPFHLLFLCAPLPTSDCIESTGTTVYRASRRDAAFTLESEAWVRTFACRRLFATRLEAGQKNAGHISQYNAAHIRNFFGLVYTTLHTRPLSPFPSPQGCLRPPSQRTWLSQSPPVSLSMFNTTHAPQIDVC